MDKNTPVISIVITVEDIERHFDEVLNGYSEIDISAQEFVSRVIQNISDIDNEVNDATTSIFSAIESFITEEDYIV